MYNNTDHDRFMTLWDGLNSSDTDGLPARIMVLGATNRMQDIDEAILRRMPKKFAVSLPSTNQRRRILALILKNTKLDQDFDLDYLTKVMAGMSGSDIKEACRDAAMVPVREYIRVQREKGNLRGGASSDEIRGVRTNDFFGRRGGGQILEDNHAYYASKSGTTLTQSKKRSATRDQGSSSDEYEDVDDGSVVADSLG